MQLRVMRKGLSNSADALHVLPVPGGPYRMMDRGPNMSVRVRVRVRSRVRVYIPVSDISPTPGVTPSQFFSWKLKG